MDSTYSLIPNWRGNRGTACPMRSGQIKTWPLSRRGDSDLQIRGVPGDPDPDKKGRGGPVSKKNLFGPSGLLV